MRGGLNSFNLYANPKWLYFLSCNDRELKKRKHCNIQQLCKQCLWKVKEWMLIGSHWATVKFASFSSRVWFRSVGLSVSPCKRLSRACLKFQNECLENRWSWKKKAHSVNLISVGLESLFSKWSAAAGQRCKQCIFSTLVDKQGEGGIRAR